MTSIEQLLPPSLLLGPHLSAYRYFFVCTLTIASWDTLVLTTRSWRLSRTKEWPTLKIIMLLLRYLMPIEFIILAVSCFNPAFTPEVCSRFYLFEPIMTAILMSLSSLALVIRVRAINDTSASRQRAVTLGLGALLAAQVVVHFVCCFFYHPLNLQDSHGCIPAPKHNWVGIYWVTPTILYLCALLLVINRSVESLGEKKVGWWKLINRDGLNLYGTIFAINLVNVIYFFVTRASDDADPIKIIVSTLATVLTSTMTMRVILLVRGSLVKGGSFHGSIPPGSSMGTSGGVVRGGGGTGPVHISGGQHSFKGGASKFSQTPTFAITRSAGADPDQVEDDEMKKTPVVDVADDIDSNVWNISKSAAREDDSPQEPEEHEEPKETWND